MDSEKPKPDPSSEPGSDPSPEKDEAHRRVERLTGSDGTGRDSPTDAGDSSRPRSGPKEAERSSAPEDAPESESASDGDTGGRAGTARSGDNGESGGPRRLTERQRREAREKRRQQRGGRKVRRRSDPSGTRSEGPSGNPLSRGIRATGIEIRRTAGFAWRSILNLLERLGPAVRFVATGLASLVAAAWKGVVRIAHASRAAVSQFGRFLLRLNLFFSPRRALILVAAAAVVTLVVSQFTDFRATEIGRAAYDPILDITRAPRTDVLTPTGAHSVLLLLVAAAAIAGVAGVALTGRRVFAATISLAGAATIAVSLLIDLPRGLDLGEAEISYSEAAAILLSGFWIQLGAGLVLTVGGLGLLALAGEKRKTAAGRQTGTSRERGAAAGGGPRSAGAGGLP